MGSPNSVTTENPEPRRRRPGGAGSKGTPTAATDDAFVDAAYSYERPSRGPWPSEVPPTGVLMTGVLGELAFFYGACWLHHRSEQRRGK
jgi:hypothetical protein